MSLPKFNNQPKYELIIPSTKETVRFRPYLVKEEKVLIMAFESGDMKSSMNAIADTIVTCLDKDIKAEDLTPYDVEYMFLAIRAKSVGETSNVFMACGKCKENVEVSLNLEEAQIEYPKNELSNMIDMGDNIVVEVVHPSYKSIVSKMKSENDQTTIDYDAVQESIKAIHYEDQRFEFKDQPKEERDAFIEEMSTVQLLKINEYLENVPRTVLNVEYACPHCQTVNQKKIEGLQNFF